MYALLLHLPIFRSWASDAPLPAALETAPIIKPCGDRPTASSPAIAKQRCRQRLTSLASTCSPDFHSNRGPVHWPGLCLAWPLSIAEEHTSGLAPHGILVSGAFPLWCLKDTKNDGNFPCHVLCQGCMLWLTIGADHLSNMGACMEG